ncbi:MAG: hypothetical protein HZA17_00105 [Nitrospirae bacterium]|nr:hypothetical protein [Nitrospirota bacterium]
MDKETWINSMAESLWNRKSYAALIISAAFGFLIAVGNHPPTWQVPVETGQVLAGIVQYPVNNPMYLYHIKVWSLLNQAGALLLAAGVSEISLSLLIAGLMGAVSCAALYLVTFSFSRDYLLSLISPLFVYGLNLVGYGHAYPIWLMGTSHSYGILGLSYILMTAGFLGTGNFRTGALLAGLSPAVHPSLGVFMIIIISVSFFFNAETFRTYRSSIVIFSMLGCLLGLASFGYQYRLFADLPVLDTQLKSQYLDSFIENFDLHRSITGWDSPGIRIALLNCLIGITVITRKTTPRSVRLISSIFAVSVVCSIVFSAAAIQLPKSSFLNVLMPFRYFNLANIAFMAMTIGILGSSTTGRLTLPLFFGGSLLLLLFPDLKALFYYVAGIGALLTILYPSACSIAEKASLRREKLHAITIGLVLLVTAMTTVAPAAYNLIFHGDEITGDFRNMTNDQFFAIISEREGLLLTAADLHLIQMVTRRPVLLDGGGLDFLPYVPESGPELNAILRDVYGLDIFSEPPAGQKNSAVITDLHRPLWENRALAEWQMIRSRFKVTDILTPADWHLNLPVIASDKGLTLYTIP